MKKRGLDRQFLIAMRDKLECGRRTGYIGWDKHWKGCTWYKRPFGVDGILMDRLFEEVRELVVAVAIGKAPDILSEAADVANMAMMVADIHGSNLLPQEANEEPTGGNDDDD